MPLKNQWVMTQKKENLMGCHLLPYNFADLDSFLDFLKMLSDLVLRFIYDCSLMAAFDVFYVSQFVA